MNILISTICFINRNKPGAEIYATFTQRLIEDIMSKTPFDIMVTTNESEHFTQQKEKYGERIIVRTEGLENHRLTVGPFNQLLKFFSIKDIDSKYDWVLYLDCDAGLSGSWDIPTVENLLRKKLSEGYDFLGTRTNCILLGELLDHEKKVEEYNKLVENGEKNPYVAPNLFSKKFVFYEVSSENGPKNWFDAKLPSEHVLLIKNDEKLPKMCQTFEDFCFKFETQVDNIITWDMEAFEIGVSALISGYNIGELDNYELYNVIQAVCNYNNWEKVKY